MEKNTKTLASDQNTVSTAVLEYKKVLMDFLVCSTCWISEMDITLHYMQHHPPGSDAWMHHGMLMKTQRITEIEKKTNI